MVGRLIQDETVTEADLARELPITGYLDRVSARPGERIEAKVSVQTPGRYTADVVRILCADPNPEGPGLIYEPVDFDLASDYPARRQEIDRGSYALMPLDPIYARARLGMSLLVQPWLLYETPSTLVASLTPEGLGWALKADTARLTLMLTDANGARASVHLPCSLRLKRWHQVWGGWDREAGSLSLGMRAWPDGEVQTERVKATFGPLPSAPLALAAEKSGPRSARHFNGRLEDPCLLSEPPSNAPPVPADVRPGAVLAWWDFARGIDTQTVMDRGPRGLSGRLVNFPTRAVRGTQWTGEAMDWKAAPRDYAAIHFHEDDLHDCGWDTDFTLTIPEGAQSATYGLRLHKDGAEDVLPLHVIPPKSGPKARVCVLASTFTHQAYANHARGNTDDAMRQRMADWGSPPNADDYPLYGRSTYNLHPDGSGIAYCSRLRPTLTIRPGYLTFDDPRGSGLRHFPADSHLQYWLHARGIEFDIITDDDLDAEGVAALDGYAVLVTGSHPEYHTSRTLDAITGFRAQGGNLMYLGGNGFYWRVAHSPTLPGLIELRRAEGGIRAWSADTGEYYHQLDGAYGGLWRRNGRPPQSIGGVGFSAQGLFTGSYYRRTDDSHAPDLSWVFDGVDESPLGDYGLSGGGAAGFELDRADVTLGTPETAIILARSEGHDDNFVTVPEELLSHVHTITGEAPADLVRGEIIYVPADREGALFATGSITYCGSLNHKDGQNGISRLTENVLRRFAGI
ncbi:MAG: N,N-dimethylformamidase beta subunit family domain-containing protein [Paracoccaceae bacterium]